MKIALITDTHAGVRNDAEHFADYQEKFYSNVFFPTLEREEIDVIIHGGDIFDRRTFTNHKSLARAKEMFFDRLVEDNLDMILIVGNHDVAYKNTNEINSPTLFLDSYRDNISVIDADVKVQYFESDVPFYFVPWINNSNYQRIVDTLQKAEPGVVIGHFEFSGFDMHKGTASTHGMDSSLFRNHKLVISGHFHTQSKKGNIHYIGNPFQFTWNDYGDKRGFWIIDTETLDMQFVENPYTMFYQFTYNDSKKNGITAPENYADIEGTYVKLFVESKAKDIAAFDIYLEKLYNANPIDLQIVDLDTIHIGNITEDDVVNATKSTTQLIKTYVGALEGLDDELKKDVEDTLLSVYAEALGEV